ncbi:hypothetical protein O181_077985, partial [Austropuccinia psidii MF-1]|nr:hypothetical protein [Austropuccinia psidii MF-1]
MNTTNRHKLRWQRAIQLYRGNMTIIFKKGKRNKNCDGLNRFQLENVKRDPAYDPEVAVKTPIHLMEIDRRKSLRFCGRAQGSGTQDTN